jgi:hypothetical protein
MLLTVETLDNQSTDSPITPQQSRQLHGLPTNTDCSQVVVVLRIGAFAFGTPSVAPPSTASTLVAKFAIWLGLRIAMKLSALTVTHSTKLLSGDTQV